jgi:hypothetical protein
MPAPCSSTSPSGSASRWCSGWAIRERGDGSWDA